MDVDSNRRKRVLIVLITFYILHSTLFGMIECVPTFLSARILTDRTVTFLCIPPTFLDVTLLSTHNK